MASPPRRYPERLAWRVWPLRDHLPWSLLPLLGLVGLGLLVSRVTGQPIFGGASGVVVALASWRYFLPITYSMGPAGLSERVFIQERAISWSRVGSYAVKRRGIVLLPMDCPIPLDSLRALYVPWGPYQEEVLRLAQYYLGDLKRLEAAKR